MVHGLKTLETSWLAPYLVPRRGEAVTPPLVTLSWCKKWMQNQYHRRKSCLSV